MGTKTMDCPYCSYSAGRMLLHRHLVDEHAGEVERDGAVLRFECPHCGEGGAVDAGRGAGVGENEVERFARDLALLAFDALLDHLEREHG